MKAASIITVLTSALLVTSVSMACPAPSSANGVSGHGTHHAPHAHGSTKPIAKPATSQSATRTTEQTTARPRS